MADLPRTRSDYDPAGLDLVKATCLDLASYLGDYWDDLVIVGGYVPTLLVEPNDGVEAHPGTLDVDLGLSLGVLEGDRYQEIANRLRQAGYEPAKKESGEPIHFCWRRPEEEGGVSVDFLIEDPGEGVKPGKSFHLGEEFAPICTEALAAAFADRIPVHLEGSTLRGEKIRRTVQVCGPAAFVVLKVYAFRNRGLPKDAFDLYYMIRNYGIAGPEDVAARWPLLRELDCSSAALGYLRDDFSSELSIGPRRVAEFVEQPDDDELAVDVVGFVGRLVELVQPGGFPDD